MPSAVGWGLTFPFVTMVWVLFRAPTFEVALRIYEGLIGLTTLGSGFKWRAIALAAALAMIGPTAILFVVVLFKIGDYANYEFIYFQF